MYIYPTYPPPLFQIRGLTSSLRNSLTGGYKIPLGLNISNSLLPAALSAPLVLAAHQPSNNRGVEIMHAMTPLLNFGIVLALRAHWWLGG